MSRRASLLGIVGLTGQLLSCGPLKPYSLDTDAGGSTSAAAESSGTSTTSVTADPSTSSSSTASITGATSTGESPQVCPDQDCPPGHECVLSEADWDTSEGVCTPTCELLSDDCPEGQKCFVYGSTWQYNHCVPLAPNPAGLGEPCTWDGPWDEHVDTCAADLVCWYPQWTEPDPAPGTGVCLPHCAFPEGGTCPDGLLCLFLGQTSDLGICKPPCDPLQPSCPTGSACDYQREIGEFACNGTHEAEGYGSPCPGSWGCTDGHLCVGADEVPGCTSEACCTRYCDTGAPNTCPDAPNQECVSWIEFQGDNPELPGEKFAHIGLCMVP